MCSYLKDDDDDEYIDVSNEESELGILHILPPQVDFDLWGFGTRDLLRNWFSYSGLSI